jgi:P-type Cu+ transporter
MKPLIIFISIFILGIVSVYGNNYSFENNAMPDSVQVCPVTRETIEQGGGVKYTYLNKELIFCCEGCIKKFNKEPAKYLTELRCPVCDEDDAKKTISSENKDVKYYFCGSGCKKKFDKDADKYLSNYQKQ